MSVQCVRYRGKINIQRPRQLCYEKARIVRATRPIFAADPRDTFCGKAPKTGKAKKNQKNPYHAIIAREVREQFDASQLIVFFHENPFKAEANFDAQVAFHKQGMKLKSYGRTIMSVALKGSIYKPIMPLFATKTSIVFSPEPKVAQVLKIVKKIPQLILMAGIAHGRYLSKNELERLAQMPDLQVTRAQFAAVLDSVGGQLVRDLQAHQTNFVGLLDQHAKSADQPTEETKPDDSSSTAS